MTDQGTTQPPEPPDADQAPGRPPTEGAPDVGDEGADRPSPGE